MHDANPARSVARDARFPRSRPWSSAEVLHGLDREQLAATQVGKHAELLWYDTVTEYDSQNFFRHVGSLRDGGQRFSADFQAFEDAWLIDERNHYEGYRQLLSMVSGRSEDDIHAEVTSREADFGPVKQLLHDEFSVCVVLAYDELFTAQSCNKDFELFSSSGDPRLARWIRLVARDEGYHFLNIVDVLRRNYAHRRAEVPAMLDTLLHWDEHERPYQATFVLDHVSERFTRESLQRNVDVIMHLLDA
ncbi:MAG: hypothetical protein K0V04_15390 [Deltaproteobacteria bacterium]|nr:hypothetical protein [Deltaproteobacteria bacterium]